MQEIDRAARAFVAAYERGGDEEAWRRVAKTPWAKKHRHNAEFIEAVRRAREAAR